MATRRRYLSMPPPVREPWWPEYISLTREPEVVERRPVSAPPVFNPQPSQRSRLVEVSAACSMVQEVFDDLDRPTPDPHYSPRDLAREARDSILRPPGLASRGLPFE